MHFAGLFVTAIAAVFVAAHPGEDHHHEAAERRDFLNGVGQRDLSHCRNALHAQGVEARSIQRRAEIVARISKNGSMRGRDITTLLNTSHESDDHFNSETPDTTIFASNGSCILQPETTEGPYYVEGEHIRQDVIEGQKGVPLWVDVQIVDVETCKPVVGVYFEIWHCNSTGVYSGISAGGNGNSAADKSNLAATFLRGIQPTNDDGAAMFATLFPGHYAGRTAHIHIMVHTGAMPEANGTLLSLLASHVGQMFFDQSLIDQVEATDVYKANKQPLTTNAQDGVLAAEGAGSDPFMTYAYLGDGLEDGLFAWLSIGINITASREVSAAGVLGGKSDLDTGDGPSGGSNMTAGVPSGTVVGTALPSVSSSGAKRRWS